MSALRRTYPHSPSVPPPMGCSPLFRPWLTRVADNVVMLCVADEEEKQSTLAVSASLCVDGAAFDRFGRVLRHLAVGLVDQAVRLRLLSADPRAESLSLGPIQTLLHEPIAWPAGRRRIAKVVEALQHDPPTTVHALSVESYRLAGVVAKEFDADLLLEVASMADCAGLSRMADARVAGCIVVSEAFVKVLEDQVRIPSEQIHLVRPGVLAGKHTLLFADPERPAMLLCTSSFERGNGVDLLIEATRILQQRDRKVMVFLLGRGSQELTLRRLVRQRGLSGRVTFADPLGDVAQAMRSADVFVRPSADTAFTTDALLAMGSGTVVVAFPSVICDHFRNGETAMICREQTAEALAEALEVLIADPAEARRIADAGREYVRTHHAVSAMGEGTAAVYRRLALARATFSITE